MLIAQIAEAILALIGLAVVLDVVGKVIHGHRRRAWRMREWVEVGGSLRRVAANDRGE